MLSILDLSASYGKSAVLHGVTLKVDRETTAVILGRNGMGKTTLVRSILGLDPPTVVSGKIEFEGQDITSSRPYDRARRGIGLVPQGRRVFASLSVRENLEFADSAASSEHALDWDMDAVLDLFPRLKERLAASAGVLSGGEQQMLAIGRALMMKPSLLVMDEPSEGLAPIIVEVLTERFLELKEQGLTMLVIEQNLGLGLDIANIVHIMQSGQVVYSGSPSDLTEDPSIIDQYLGVTMSKS